MHILKVVFVVLGTLIGAGFASGQEVNIFFYSYGMNGIYGIALSSALIGIIIYFVFRLIDKENINSYTEFLDKVIRNRREKEVINLIINTFILISFYIMVAGFGAYLKQEYSINSWIGSGIFAFLCYITLKKGIKGLVKINEILIPVLVIVVVLIRYSKF